MIGGPEVIGPALFYDAIEIDKERIFVCGQRIERKIGKRIWDPILGSFHHIFIVNVGAIVVVDKIGPPTTMALGNICP